jgi:glycosyltransferase involved in cell wall biosynthesis
MPQISVIMCNFNKEKYVSEAIRSVLNQTLSDWELLIVDDGSTDNSVSIINSFKYDKRIKIIHNEKNRGKPWCLNLAVNESASPLIGILDSDDALFENALEEMVKVHNENPDAGMAYSQYENCDEKMSFSSTGECRQMLQDDTNLRSYFAGPFCTFKKSVIQKTSGYNEKFICAEDRDIIYKIEEVGKLVFHDKILYKYRFLNDSISHDKEFIPFRDMLDVDAKYDAYMRRKKTKTPNLNKMEMSTELYRVCLNGIRVGEYIKAWKYFFKAFTMCPLNVSLIKRFFMEK